MAETGVFERRSRGEARVVWAGSVALCGLGWASTVWPVVPGLIVAALVAIGVAVAVSRRAAGLRLARAIREQAPRDQEVWDQAARGQGPPREDEVSDVFGTPVLHVVDAERDAA